MRKNIVLLLILTLASCQKKETKTLPKPVEKSLKTSDLYSKVYYISTRLNTEDCIAYNDGCDCCDGKIVFLKNGTFISDFYCIPTESYTTGTFKVEGKKLVLNYRKKEALFGPEDDGDYDGEDVLRLNNIDYGQMSLDIISCKDHYIFKNRSDYYSEHKKTSFQLAVNKYKRDGVWKILNIKE